MNPNRRLELERLRMACETLWRYRDAETQTGLRRLSNAWKDIHERLIALGELDDQERCR